MTSKRHVRCLAILGLLATTPAAAGDKGASPEPVRLGSARFANLGRVFAVAYSDDGRLLAGGAWDGSIRVWELATGKERFLPHKHKGPVRRLAFSHDGKRLASAGAAPGVCLWDVQTGMLDRVLGTPNDQGSDVAFAPDDKHIAAIARGTLFVCDAAGKVLWSQGGERVHTRLAFDGAASLASVYAKRPRGKLVPSDNLYHGKWAVTSAKELETRMLGQRPPLGPLNLGPGDLVVRCTVEEIGRREVIRWSRAGRWDVEQRLELAGQNVSVVCASPDGRMLAVTGDSWGSEAERSAKFIRVSRPPAARSAAASAVSMRAGSAWRSHRTAARSLQAAST